MFGSKFDMRKMMTNQVRGGLQQNNSSKLKIRDFYGGKHILITGCTGFTGKVILYKLLKSCSNVGKIYLLLRSKRTTNKIEILNNLISSPCFDEMKNQMGDTKFNEFIMEKIIPLSGDLIHEGLGLVPEDRDLITENVQVIINNASSTGTEPLKESLKLNYFGHMRMMELAKQCRKIEAFCHMSTAFVNSNMAYDTIIDEQIYDSNQSVERIISQILKMNPIQVKENMSNILNGYPNSFTFCQALAEKSMKNKRGTLPMCIIRPTLIGGSLKEPYPGWYDTLNLLAAPIVYTGMGLHKFMIGKGKQTIDVTCVDMLVNHILIATAHCALNPGEL